MAILEKDALLIADWCRARSPENLKDQLRIECEIADRAVTILEARPPWDDPAGIWTQSAVARLTYAASTALWTLYWQDSDFRFRRHDETPPASDVQTLLDVVDDDPYNLFWG